MKDSHELIQRIAENIEKHRILETKELISGNKNLAVGFAEVNYFGEDRKIWLTTHDNHGGYRNVQDITGHIVSTTSGHPTTLTTDGLVVNKNSKAGDVIINNVHGSGQIRTPHGFKEILVNNLSSFVPNPNNADAIDLVLDLDESRHKRYSRLQELLDIFRKAETSIQQLEEEEHQLQSGQREDEELELQRIAEQIENAKRERENALSKVKSFIRKSAELRYQPILDTWQDKTRRSLIYNGTLVIDGGPGTGKTTALIQRIKFLLDKEAMLGSAVDNSDFVSDGYFSEMSDIQKKILFENNRNWIFFTPNELLKLFLRNNMIQEGLRADDQRVRVWKDYLNQIVKDYELVKVDTQNPFLFLRKRLNENLLPQDGKQIKQLLNSFEKFLLGILNAKLDKLTALKLEPFDWKSKGISIQNYINRSEKDYTVEGLLRLYFNLQESYHEEVDVLKSEFNNLLAKAAARIEREAKNNQDFYKAVFEYAEDWKNLSNSIDEAENEEEDEELEDNTGDLNGFLFGKYKLLIKNAALSTYDPSVRLSKKYQDFSQLIEKHIQIKEYDSFDQIGQLAYFVKYFVTCTKGVVRNIFSEIPKAYKDFRKKQLTNGNPNWNLDLLQHLVIDDKSRNKRLHPEEQALLIYFINNTIGKSYKVSKRKSQEIGHSYFQGFKNHSIPVIGVDEATDFHIMDLLAMHSLSDLEISSVTFSGDLMQRLTFGGIRDWNELNDLINNLEVKQLLVSYRQSHTLLELASFIYQKATGRKADYISYLDRDDSEPKPLLFRSDNEKEKIDWIGERILEIYQAYGRQFIPSIAVFLPSDEGIEEFTLQLSEIDELADVGIKVRASKDGQVLGDKNTVRVFPVEYIKGMEFEAVFFHNMDFIKNTFESEEMIMKHLYVGLSRASFYIGVTSGKNNKFEFLENHFKTNSQGWQ